MSENTECVENGEEKVDQKEESKSEGGEKSSTETTSKDSEKQEEKSCQSSSQTNTDEKDKVSVGKKRKFFTNMCKRLSDLLVIGILLSNLISYVLNSDEAVRRKTRRPEPFFDDNSLVRDYWEGNVFQAFKDAQYFESSFIMFYAHWDRESQQSRSVLQTVAHHYRNSDVLIAAVNCWFPVSDCAKEFGGKNGSGTVLPVFIFYPNTMNGVQFNGDVTPAHIIRFIDQTRWPIVHLHSVQHLDNLQVEYENVLVGYLPNTKTYQLHHSHKDLLSAALAFNEILSEKPVCTAVVTSEVLAKQINIHGTKPVILFTHNSTFNYPNKTIDNEKLVQWTLSNIAPTSSWLNLIHKKSRNLQRIFESGSGNVLLLFSPRPSLFEDKAYQILRQVSTDYFNCDKSEATHNLVNKLKMRSSGSNSCSSNKFSTSITSSPTSCNLKPWSVTSPPEHNFPACTNAACTKNKTAAGCAGKVQIPRGQQSIDPNVYMALEEVEWERADSEKMSSSADIFTDTGTQEDNADIITALGCAGNKTLRMYRVDSSVYSTLLERLGLEDKKQPLPVIINSKLESVHYKEIRSGHLSQDLRSLISMWHSGDLPATGAQGHRSSDSQSVIRYKVDLLTQDKPDSLIREISANTFNDILDSGLDTVLLITTSSCSECSAISGIFHSLQMYLSNVDKLRFALIDGSKNDLKWQFNTFSYPAILYIPRNRSAESRAFPSDENMNLPNLLRFILSNLSLAQRLAINLHFCDSHCKQKLRIRCEKNISELSTKLRTRYPLPAQLSHKFTRKLIYTRKLLSVILKLQAAANQDSSETKSMSSEEIQQLFLK